mmetsp:Transcript_33973/g.79976  ORF Transcript_33973/g.79976 Transcript_33973/m.79976 type:complete len:239 (-) Transcript_33973:335-1051(-)
MASLYHYLLVLILVAASLLPGTESFRTTATLASHSRSSAAPLAATAKATTKATTKALDGDGNGDDCRHGNPSRRAFLSRAAIVASWSAIALAGAPPAKAAADASENVQSMRSLLLEAKAQLDTVPGLLKEEKWDGVRGLLTEAPLRDCWSKTTPILKTYAEAIGDTGGDELSALEGREDLLQHLRFLDMAVYNNVFNPIATEGKTGASKALIDSYYNDPTREYEASKKALDELLQLSN